MSSPAAPRAFVRRAAQRRLHAFIDLHRVCAFLARRQYGKTTTVAEIALKKMMRTRQHTVVFGSAKLSLSREIIRKEALVMQSAVRSFAKDYAGLVSIADARTGKALPSDIQGDDLAEVFEAQQMEFRLFHSRSAFDYSRTKIVALLPDTVGETGDLITDEVGRVKNWREVVEAILPIISSNPAFRWIQTTTPPPDDTHFSFEMLAPPPGTEFPVNPAGNEYVSEHGIHVLRCDAFDAAADGVPLYDDDTGAPLTPAEHRAASHDKQAWDRNYGVKFIAGGSAAVSSAALATAQARGVGQCSTFVIEDDLDFDNALAWLAKNLGANPVTLGVDWATTEKATSNPTAVAICEREGNGYIFRAVFVWKTNDEDLAEERLEKIVRTVNARPQGGRARRLCQDATSEKYFCNRIKKNLRAHVPVRNLVGSESFEKPGGEKMTLKQHLCGAYVEALEDNQVTLPPDRYLREDHRLPRREKGSFVCESTNDGKHGDTFDACRNAMEGHSKRGGDAQVIPTRVGAYQGGSR